MRLHADGGLLELAGGFRRGDTWRYGPVRLNWMALNEGKWSEEDCWLRANVLSFGTALKVVRGELAGAEALASGSFSLAKA